MAGNESVRLAVEGYGDYTPFAFDINQVKGFGNFATSYLDDDGRGQVDYYLKFGL